MQVLSRPLRHPLGNLVSSRALLLLLLANPILAERKDKFKLCKQNIEDLLIHGNRTSIGTYTRDNIYEHGLIYNGTARELKSSYPRDQYLLITYDGCKALCSNESDNPQLADPMSAMSMVATWIFPLAIVLSLPYEGHHLSGFKHTLASVLNWLGSPQTALTATIFNFWQIRKAQRMTANKEARKRVEWNDAYYVVTCLNQFELPKYKADRELFVRTLVYGLCSPALEESSDTNSKAHLTAQLLTVIAHQLRMHRRRAVLPTLASLGTFLIAYVFSIVLSFAQISDETGAEPLVVGLAFGWLPILVIFTIVDRNPTSSERTATLISRWLYNVHAVWTWDGQSSAPINWWTRPVPRRTGPLTIEQQNEQDRRADQIQLFSRFKLGPFSGQGRRPKFFGLSWAAIEETKAIGDGEEGLEEQYVACADNILGQLDSAPPVSWYIIAVLALVLVWVEVGMAIMLAFNSPTIGLGCWSGSFLLYGILSSVSWCIQILGQYHVLRFAFTPVSYFLKEDSTQAFLRYAKKSLRAAMYFFNTLALGWLITFTFLILTGATNSCYCNTVHLWGTRYGDYMNFENVRFHRKYSHVINYWALAAGFGLAVPLITFVVAVYWWVTCKPLWKAKERDEGVEMVGTSRRVDWSWLT